MTGYFYLIYSGKASRINPRRGGCRGEALVMMVLALGALALLPGRTVPPTCALPRVAIVRMEAPLAAGRTTASAALADMLHPPPAFLVQAAAVAAGLFIGGGGMLEHGLLLSAVAVDDEIAAETAAAKQASLAADARREARMQEVAIKRATVQKVAEQVRLRASTCAPTHPPTRAHPHAHTRTRTLARSHARTRHRSGGGGPGQAGQSQGGGAESSGAGARGRGGGGNGQAARGCGAGRGGQRAGQAERFALPLQGERRSAPLVGRGGPKARRVVRRGRRGARGGGNEPAGVRGLDRRGGGARAQ